MNAQRNETTRKVKGIGVSSGIIIGKARLVERSRVKTLYQYMIKDKQTTQEVKRFKDALALSKEQIVSLKERIPDSFKGHAFILDAHLMIMDDSMLSDATIDMITSERINAEWALKKSVQKIRSLFEKIDDEYIRERIRDVENVADRILMNLAGKEQESLHEIKERVIVVAHDLSPVDTSAMNINKIMGFITDVGGKTSHTAIIAQAMKLPAVVGLETVTQQVQDGDLLIVDGGTGEVIINPEDQLIIEYEERQLKQREFESSIVKSSHLPAATVDGHAVKIYANIEFQEEVSIAKQYGAEGIGLYRTEFLYLRSERIPTEEELFEDYRDVTERMSPQPVTIRTLDLGGDKFSSTLGLKKEMNPALGLRAIRFCLKEQRIFKEQIRAILRASAFGNLRIMFPMISGLQEVYDAKRIFAEVRRELDNEKIPYDPKIQMGIMIEIPSAVSVADVLARHVDFFSIGTNDLIQYALAIDRGNEHVAYMYQPFHPAILRMIRFVIEAARDNGIKVGLCGEMAGDPLCTYILLALGLDEWSINAGNIPLIKRAIRHLAYNDARAGLDEIYRLETAREIRDFVSQKMKTIFPEAANHGHYLHFENYRGAQG
jgi:phosphotransferase system enzyme I (PtsI)